MTHVKALQAGHSSQGTSEPITPVSSSAEIGLFRATPLGLRDPPPPRTALSGSGKPHTRPSLAFPLLYPNTRPLYYPEKAGIPNYKEGVSTPSPQSSGDISISHLGVSCGHLNVPHTSLCLSNATPDSSALKLSKSTPLRQNVRKIHHHGCQNVCHDVRNVVMMSISM